MSANYQAAQRTRWNRQLSLGLGYILLVRVKTIHVRATDIISCITLAIWTIYKDNISSHPLFSVFACIARDQWCGFILRLWLQVNQARKTPIAHHMSAISLTWQRSWNFIVLFISQDRYTNRKRNLMRFSVITGAGNHTQHPQRNISSCLNLLFFTKRYEKIELIKQPGYLRNNV